MKPMWKHQKPQIPTDTYVEIPNFSYKNLSYAYSP